MIQVLIALAMGIGILAFGLWAVRLLATQGPEEPDPDAVIDVEQRYMCTVCGLRLTVTQAQDDDVAAPRHCREPMDAI